MTPGHTICGTPSPRLCVVSGSPPLVESALRALRPQDLLSHCLVCRIGPHSNRIHRSAMKTTMCTAQKACIVIPPPNAPNHTLFYNRSSSQFIKHCCCSCLISNVLCTVSREAKDWMGTEPGLHFFSLQAGLFRGRGHGAAGRSDG